MQWERIIEKEEEKTFLTLILHCKYCIHAPRARIGRRLGVFAACPTEATAFPFNTPSGHRILNSQLLSCRIIVWMFFSSNVQLPSITHLHCRKLIQMNYTLLSSLSREVVSYIYDESVSLSPPLFESTIAPWLFVCTVVASFKPLTIYRYSTNRKINTVLFTPANKLII